MKCQKCGFDNKPESKFCEGCGKSLNTILPTKPKKPWYKKWWIWVIVGVVVIGAIGANTNKTTKSKTQITTTSTNEQTTSANEQVTEAENETEPPTIDPETVKADFIDSCSEIDYIDLARNPDKYKGEHYKFTGKVIQVLDSDSWFNDSTTLRLDVTAEENEYAEGGYLWDDTILATVNIPDGDDRRILEDDIIDIYGVCEGLYTYKTVLGDNNSLPLINIKYHSIHE